MSDIYLHDNDLKYRSLELTIPAITLLIDKVEETPYIDNHYHCTVKPKVLKELKQSLDIATKLQNVIPVDVQEIKAAVKMNILLIAVELINYNSLQSPKN